MRTLGHTSKQARVINERAHRGQLDACPFVAVIVTYEGVAIVVQPCIEGPTIQTIPLA